MGNKFHDINDLALLYHRSRTYFRNLDVRHGTGASDCYD